MNHNTQRKTARQNVSSREKTSDQRDGSKKKIYSFNELPETKLAGNSFNNMENTSTTMINNTRKILNKSLPQHESIERSPVSRSRLSLNHPNIDRNINSSGNVKLEQKAFESKNKFTSVSHHPSIDLVTNKVKKRISISDKKKSNNSVYMVKPSTYTVEKMSVQNKKVKNRDDSSTNSGKSSNTVDNISDGSKNNIKNSYGKNKLSRERKKSRTLSPSEIKVLKTNVKMSIVSSDIAKTNKESSHRNLSPDCDYEDDFEDYESDFQDCTDSDEAEESQMSDESEAKSNNDKFNEFESRELQTRKIEKKIMSNLLSRKYTEEENMLDSGHYELQEARRRAAKIDLMSTNQNFSSVAQIIEGPIKDCNIEEPLETKSLLLPADEGFEDGRSGDFIKSLSMPGVSNPIKSNCDKISSKNRTKLSRRLTRGKQLLQMIQLDTVHWSLYESIPIAYEEFIRIHGKMNTRQVSMQTNDDNISIQVQTDEIKYKNMWTQFPITCRSVLKNNNDINLFTAELAGVGNDENIIRCHPYYDILELTEFLNAAANIIFRLLVSQQSQQTSITNNDCNSNQLPFSETTVKLSIANIKFLSGRSVTMIRYSDISSNILLTIHESTDSKIETSPNKNFYTIDCCIGCLWNIYQPSRPIKLFYSSNNITACCFHPTNYNIVFGGLEDGSVSLWDLEENEHYHQQIIDKENIAPWILRCVTFNSGGNSDEKIQSKIVALTVLSKVEVNNDNEIGNFMPLQICSLNEEGKCVVWSVLKNFGYQLSINQDLGQSWWGKLRLIRSHELFIHTNKGKENNEFLHEFRDIIVDSIDKNKLYVAANISQILNINHFDTKSMLLFCSEFDYIGGATCMEICPFGQPFFLVGYEDGTINLYSSTIKRPLLQLKNLNSNALIRTIQWSKSKPFMIFVLDDDANMHIWDLSQSDNSPALTVTLDNCGDIISMQLSPLRTDHDMANQYMAIGLNNGAVEIHKLKENYHNLHRDNLTSELKKFLNYLDIY